MPITPNDINKEIQDFIDEFAESIEPIQQNLFNKIITLLKQLTVDSAGAVKKTVANMKIAQAIQKEIDKVVRSAVYQSLVAGIDAMIDRVLEMQKKYFTVFTENVDKPFIAEIHKQSFELVVSQLTDAGIKANVSIKAANLVRTGVMEGEDFSTIHDQLKTFMIGNKDVPGRMVSYSSQMVNDAIHGASRAYNEKMVEDLDLKWFQYVGAIGKNSRPICPALVRKQWIHKSELGSIARGIVDGKKVGTQGMIPGTNAENIINRCGGFNCPHSMIPVPPEAVPESIRAKFENN